MSAGPDFDIRIAGMEFRASKRKIPAWLWVAITAVATTGGTWFVTYYETLRAAGSRVAALEESDRLEKERSSRLEVRLNALESAANRAAVVNGDQDAKIGRMIDAASTAPIVVKPGVAERAR